MQIGWVAPEKICNKADSWFKGCWPWNKFFLNFFFKNWQLLNRSFRIFRKNSEQRPKGQSSGLYMAFLALETVSFQVFLRKSAPFQVSSKLDYTESDYFPPPSSLLCLFTVGTEVQMDREDAFWKNIFAKSVLTIYPDPQSLGLDWSSRFRWGLFTKLKNHAITTWFRIALSAMMPNPTSWCHHKARSHS